MEQILKIDEHSDGEDWNTKGGYVITTNNQTIKLLMDTDQQCCENAGYFISEDDFTQFIGAEIFDIKVTDTELKEGLLKQHDLDINDKWFEGGVMFVDIITSKGTLQFVAYNEHNGYYGHEAKIISEQLNHEEWI